MPSLGMAVSTEEEYKHKAPLTRERIDEVVTGSHRDYCFLRSILDEVKKFGQFGVREFIDSYRCNPQNDCANCTLKDLVLKHTDVTDRGFVQLKCVHILKYTESGTVGRDIGKDAAWQIWFLGDFYERFRAVYSPTTPADQIFREVIPADRLAAYQHVKTADPAIFQAFVESSQESPQRLEVVLA